MRRITAILGSLVLAMTLTAANGQEAVEQAKLYCPDVIVMDISMPVMSGIEATKHICKICEHTKVAILSMHHTTEYIQRAWEAGAVGYLLKDSAGAELVAAIRAVHDGKRYISKNVVGKIARDDSFLNGANSIN